jgi:hypothetical protein
MAEITALTWCAKLPTSIDAIRAEAQVGMTGYEPASSPQNVYLAYLLPVDYAQIPHPPTAILDGLFGVVFRPGCRVIVETTEHRIAKWPVPMVVISVYRASEVAPRA